MRRVVVPATLAVLVAGCSSGAPSASLKQSGLTARAPTPILWSADHETGDLSQWSMPGPPGSEGTTGGEYDSGIADATISASVARSGRYSVALTITAPPESGTRLFRKAESRLRDALYYSVWYYVPEPVTLTGGFTNNFQWKSGNGRNDEAIFVIRMGRRPTGTPYFYLEHKTVVEVPIRHEQSIRDIPIRRWLHVEGFYRCAGDHSGRVMIWQDGVLLFDVANVQTRYSDGDCQWSVNNYSDGLEPRPTTIFIDDAAISTARLGPTGLGDGAGRER